MIELKPKIHLLSNGIRLVYLHSNSPVAHLGLTFLAGSRYENEQEIGLAHFLEHCIFKGTEKRKTIQVLSRLDDVGGEINAYTTKEEICVYASFLKNHFSRSAELLADIAIHSNFPEKEIAKEKEIVLDELISYKDNPSEKLFDDFEALIFKGHPLGNNILGTEESIASFGKKELKKYVEKYFFAENCVISFVGDLSEKKVLQILEKYFAKMGKGKELSAPVPFSKYEPIKQRIAESNYQTHAIIGGMAPGHHEEDRRGMTLLINILGGPALNSRLNLSVREKYGYTYSIEAHYSTFSEIGYWNVYFGTDEKYLNKTLKVVYAELKKLREQELTEKQLKTAKEQLKGHIALSLDSNVGLMQGLGKSLLQFNQIDTIEEIYSNIDNLTSSELKRIANQYFNEELISELIFELKD